MAVYDLSGKTALVTGAARGIGFATAKTLVARGANVAIVDLRADAAEAAAASIHDSAAIGFGADVVDRGALQRAVSQTVERFGGLDVVVANAGVASTPATYRATAPEVFDRVLDVNLTGVHNTVAAALPQIVERRGHVVVISSIYAFANGAGQVAYAMSKAAVEQLGRALRVELVTYGASASVAYFGFIDTEMVHQGFDQDPLRDTFNARIPPPLRKRLDPEVAGRAIVDGIEHRRPRIVRPRRWAALSMLRGVVNPVVDMAMERDPRFAALVRKIDDRAAEEQRTTL